MVDEDAIKTNNLLSKTNKVCRFINAAMMVVFAVFCITWILVAGTMLYSAASAGFAVSDVFRLIFFLLSGFVIVAIFVVLIKVFFDVAKGDSPFVMTQVKRLQLISFLLVIYTIFDFVISCNTASLQLESINSGYFSTNESAIIPINFAPLIAAAVVFAFSFVFKYGVLLQEFSDDTV